MQLAQKQHMLLCAGKLLTWHSLPLYQTVAAA